MPSADWTSRAPTTRRWSYPRSPLATATSGACSRPQSQLAHLGGQLATHAAWSQLFVAAARAKKIFAPTAGVVYHGGTVVRPSQLQIAERCGLAPVLAARYPTDSDAAAEGRLIHEQIARCLTTGEEPPGADVRAAVDYASRWPATARLVEHDLELVRDGKVVTRGRADLVVREAARVVVVDWKTGRGPAHGASEDLQIATYAAAAAAECGADRALVVLARLGGGECRPDEAELGAAELDAAARRAAAVQDRPAVAHPGDHCAACWSRMYCHAWTLPAHVGPSALAPFESATQITSEQYEAALRAVAAMREAADRVEKRIRLDATSGVVIRRHDGAVYSPTVVPGRRTVSVADAMAAGRADLIRQGAPYEKWGWRKPAKEKSDGTDSETDDSDAAT